VIAILGSTVACAACGLTQNSADMPRIGWHVSGGEAILLARCVGCRTSRALLTLKDACLCEVCRRLLVNEVKHCIFDPVEGASVLCTVCYYRDERREGWERGGNPYMAEGRALVGRR
jgi:hypothetical protein